MSEVYCLFYIKIFQLTILVTHLFIQTLTRSDSNSCT
eukprot:UN17373